MSKKDFQNGFALGFASGGVVEIEKEEQEKVVDITENGTTEVTPDEGMALSKVTVNVEVESSSTEEIKGIILSDFSQKGLPQIADLRSIPLPTENSEYVNYKQLFSYRFYNYSAVSNGGMFTNLKTVYLPDGLLYFNMYMFYMCSNLENIYGDFSQIRIVFANCFRNCLSLTEIPYMPNLQEIQAQAFRDCTGLTNVKIYNRLTSFADNAFSGCTNITDIYVPWALDEVGGAPWGATNENLQIHYNTTYDENGNPIV